jgi:hypothetical protein
MIIETKNLDKNEEYFTSSPIYFLTNNLPLTKFFHILSSTQVAYGTNIEKELRDFILDNRSDVQCCNYYEFKGKDEGIWINKDKKMIAGKLPDIIIYNANDKIITNAEIKIRADRTSGKGIPNDIDGNRKICEELQSKFSDFKIDNIVVTLFEPQGAGNIKVWERLGANVVLGKDFLKDYFNLEFSDFRERLNRNTEINNKTILKLITDVKKSTQNQLKDKTFISKGPLERFE